MRVKVGFSELTIDFEKSKKRSKIAEIFSYKNTKLSDKTYKKDTS